MRRGSPAASSESGIALIMGVIVTVVCLVVVGGLMQYVLAEYRSTHLDTGQVQALYCAEAGVEMGVQALRLNPSANGIAETPLSRFVPQSSGAPAVDGTFEVTIASLANGSFMDRRIAATGYWPNKAACVASPPSGVSRTVTAVYGSSTVDLGQDAVRARNAIRYASNENLTVVVDEAGNPITDTSVNASIRVTGTGATIGPIESLASNRAKVAGDIGAPGFVDIEAPTPPFNLSQNDPSNYLPQAFPPAEALGTWDGDGNLICPPAAGTIADMYYREALAGGTLYYPSGTITAPKHLNLAGGWLRNVTLLGPGTIFLNGHLGGGVVNGYPPCTLVVTRNFVTAGGESYTFDPGSDPSPPPSLISFGPYLEIQGDSSWKLNGPLMALSPNAKIVVNDSAITCLGALISNGTVDFKSSKGGLGFPRTLANRRFTLRGLPVVTSYTAQ